MSASVDVLAVLDYEIKNMRGTSIDWGPQREVDLNDMRQAREAIANLIAAARPVLTGEMITVRERMEMKRRLRVLSAALDSAGGAR